MSDDVESVIPSWACGFTPPPKLLVSEWADQKFRLPKKSAAKGGRWRTDDAPYLRGILDVELEAGVQKVAVIKGAQVGLTSAMQINHGYHMECDPCSMLFMLPTMAMVEKWSKSRLDDMIETVPEVAAALNSSKSTLTYKDFEGGSLALAGANTPNSFAGVDVRIAYGDDVDRFPAVVGDEGDPADLLVNRTDTYYDGIVWFVSTPTLKDGRIDTLYRRSDQRRWHVTCEDCGHRDYLTWNDAGHFRVVFEDKDPETARLRCPACEHDHDEAARRRVLRSGSWIPTAPAQEPGLVGFHVPTLLSLLGKVTMSSLVSKWLSARENGQESLKVFINTQLGEAWEAKGTRMDGHVLARRKESYGDGADVPAWASAITAGFDVQQDRLEGLVMAWGSSGERAVIDRVRIDGELKLEAVRKHVADALSKKYRHALGVDLPIHATCIDSGYQTDDVYAFVQSQRQIRRIFATKGIGGKKGEPIIGKPSEKRTGKDARPVALYPVNVDDAKTEIMSALNQSVPGPNYVHFPHDDEKYNDEFFAQLTSEHKEKVYNKRKIATHEIWVQDRERNEMFDAAVLNLVAFKLLNQNVRQMLAEIKAAAPKVESTPSLAPTATPTSPAMPAPARRRERRISHSPNLG